MLPLAAALLLAGSPGPRLDPTPIKGQPFRRYFIKDRYGREITFYLTESKGSEPKPLTVFVQGSGDGSNFVEVKGRVVPQNGQMTLYDEAKGAIRLLIVEKPGVRFLDRGEQGGAEKASADFREQHTLERWSEAVDASLRAALRLPGIDRKHVLVVGHSEGGLVACRVAAHNRAVTHVASLAGGGVTQLYDLIALARRGAFLQNLSDDPEKRVAYLTEEWKKVLADPHSAEKSFLGHPYRRWTSFLADSPIEELAQFKGTVYIAQGTADAAVDPSSADALDADLLRRGKDVTYDRVPNADHVFSTPDDKRGEGWTREMDRLLAWFLRKSL